jgi:ssDNA-binding Zn-finger/Zn-ribbon topoisomerase 1
LVKQKIEFLENRGLIDIDQSHNLKLINRLRNDYTHTLKVEAIESKYFQLVENLKLSGYVSANSHYDKFQLVIHQILFELKDIYYKEMAKNGTGKIEKGLTDSDIKLELEKQGKLFWQLCKILKHEKKEYLETYILQCPYCNKGQIVREGDRTPGFKESFFVACNNCGLNGDGSYLDIKTIKK